MNSALLGDGTYAATITVGIPAFGRSEANVELWREPASATSISRCRTDCSFLRCPSLPNRTEARPELRCRWKLRHAVAKEAAWRHPRQMRAPPWRRELCAKVGDGVIRRQLEVA
jgi:hypothetical protein